MKAIVATLFTALSVTALSASAQTGMDEIGDSKKSLFLDVHKIGPGKVKLEDVAGAHAKDLAVQGKHGVQFLDYWVDEKNGNIYCLASAHDSNSIRTAHGEAHGLVPDLVYSVTPGEEGAKMGGKKLFLDVHEFGPGNVKAKDVEGAHKKDLAVQKKYGVNFINYWVDEKAGVVMCLSEARDEKSVGATHQAAHGLIPVSIKEVHQGH